MTLVEVVRVIGVAVGIIGALITAPGAIPELWRLWGRPVVGVLRSPWRPAGRVRRANFGDAVGVSDAAVTITTKAAGVVGGSVPLDVQVELLRTRVDALDVSVRELREDNDQAHDDLAESLDRAERGLKNELDAIEDARRRRDATTIQVDAVGVPVIATSFLLTGLPDSMVRMGYVAWPIMGVAIVFTVLGIAHWARNRGHRVAASSEGA